MHALSPSVPKFKLAQQQILGWIRSGRFQPGDQLPGEQAIAGELGLNHRTVRRGLDDLARAGIIEKLPRVGNFVKGVRPRELTTPLAFVCPGYQFRASYQRPSVGSLMGGLCSELDLRDYSISTMSYGPGRLWDDVGAALVERGVRGIFLYPQREIAVEEIHRLEENNIRVVFIGTVHHRQLAMAASATVWISRFCLMRELMERLVAKGHRRIRIPMYTEFPRRIELEAIIEDVCRRASLGDIRDMIFDMPNREDPDFSRLELLLDETPAPTAMILPDEMAASELLRICYRRGIHIPRDLSVGALNNATPLAFPVHLASPDSLRDMANVGQQAANVMARLIEGCRAATPPMEIEAELEWDESIGPPRQSLQFTAT